MRKGNLSVQEIWHSIYPVTGYDEEQKHPAKRGCGVAESHITKKALAQALKEMMQTTAFAKISVGDICERCGMNRKSFYYHFKDKYDLVNWIYETEFIEQVRPNDFHSIWDFLSKLCTYFYANRRFYANALSVRGQNSFSDYFDELLHQVIAAYLMDLFSAEEEQACVDFYADAIRISIQRWLASGLELEGPTFVERIRHILITTAQRLLQEEERADHGFAPSADCGITT